MHAAVQSGGRSPKQLNGPPSTQPTKSASDSVQSSSTSYSSQAKGRKRGDKGDLGSESLKQEPSAKVDNGETGNCKLENMIKAEIAKITDKSGLLNSDAVEKLVQLMQLDRGEKKIDLAGRILLADVISGTERNDCLGRFVQLRGVPVLDDWLQEAHKGKTGDGTSPKEGDKALEDLLLALLRALDKLPVNLDALQTCNIGKSVNHLRGHRNLEIQKKARSLVDTWKKRVDAEMTKLEMTKLNDTKSAGSNQAASWSGKAGFSEVSHGGNRRSGSTEAAIKGAVVQPSACKSLPVKVVHGDSISKPNPGQSVSPKFQSTMPTSVAVGTKDSQSKTGGSSWTGEPPPSMMKEEKSSSSSQSQNNSQSCSSDHAKSLCSNWKEDSRSTAVGSLNSNKTSGGTSRHRKTSAGLMGSNVSRTQKDGSGRSRSRNTTSDRIKQPVSVAEKTVDVPVTDHGNNHRFIVRLPNPGRSPARSTSGGSFEDPSQTGSRASSPVATEKNDHIERRTKLNSDTCQVNIAGDVNTESWQSNDLKAVVGSDDGDRSTTAVLDEERSSTDETVRVVDASRVTSDLKTGKPFKASLSSINALIESCVKYSEVSASSGGDDSGMNLLASVATGEISKSDMVSPTGSPGGNSLAVEDPSTTNEVQSTFSSDNIVARVSGLLKHNEDENTEKHEIVASLQDRDEMKQDGADSVTNPFCDSKSNVSMQETKSASDCRELHPVAAAISCSNVDPVMKSESKVDVIAPDGHKNPLSLPTNMESVSNIDSSKQLRKKRKGGGSIVDNLSDTKRKTRSVSAEGSKPLANEAALRNIASENVKHEMDLVGGASCSLLPKEKIEEFRDTISNSQVLHSARVACPVGVTRNTENAITKSEVVNSDIVHELKKKESDQDAEKRLLETGISEKCDHQSDVVQTHDERIKSSLPPSSINLEENLGNDADQHHPSSRSNHEEACEVPANETGQGQSTPSKLSQTETDLGRDDCCPLEASTLVHPVPDASKNCKFDLNEGLSVDEGNLVEPGVTAVSGSSSAIHMSPSPPPVSPLPTGSLVPITVAAPAKGPFVPPEILLKGKGEPGWRGSAATSAFRPAEPRKVPEVPLGMSETPYSEATPSKQFRPLFDFDLNVPDERIAEDIASQSSSQERCCESRISTICDPPFRSFVALDLDLNRVDESTESVPLPGRTSQKIEVPLIPVGSASGSGGTNVLRDFDLNNGPSTDEVSSEQFPLGQNTKSNGLPFLPSLRVNYNELGNLSTWFPPGNSYPAVAIPSFLPDRDQPYPVVAPPSTQRILSSANSCTTFGSDLYKGQVLSSSPAMAFTPAAAFPYAGLPLGSSFPLPSSSFSVGPTMHADSAPGGPCFPAVPPPLMGNAASSQYVRPYMVNLHEGSTSSGPDSSHKWGQQNLDLNAIAGPSVEVEGRLERLPFASRQLPVPGSQAFAEEQSRLYYAAGRGSKRKEPESGWDTERFSYR